MNKLSTDNLHLIPEYDELKQICISISVLEAITCPNWEYRYYSYQKDWGEGEELFEMRDGSGSQMLILFKYSGVCVSGFNKGFKLIDNIAGVPEIFEEFIFGEPVKNIGKTFCFWQLRSNEVWVGGDFGSPEEQHEDGSVELLKLLNGNPLGYTEWANDYYQDVFKNYKLRVEDVALVYEHKVLTKELVRRINPLLADTDKLRKEVEGVGYVHAL